MYRVGRAILLFLFILSDLVKPPGQTRNRHFVQHNLLHRVICTVVNIKLANFALYPQVILVNPCCKLNFAGWPRKCSPNGRRL